MPMETFSFSVQNK